MDHLHQEEPDFLDLDKPGYYFPHVEELFQGMEVELNTQGKWYPFTVGFGDIDLSEWFNSSLLRIKYLQAKDINTLGFGRVQRGLNIFLRGSYTIVAYRLFDPAYSKIRIMQNSTPVYEGICKNKSELKRILKINEINFAE